MTVVVGVSTLATFMVLQILVPPVRVDPGDRVAFAAAEGATCVSWALDYTRRVCSRKRGRYSWQDWLRVARQRCDAFAQIHLGLRCRSKCAQPRIIARLVVRGRCGIAKPQGKRYRSKIIEQSTDA